MTTLRPAMTVLMCAVLTSHAALADPAPASMQPQVPSAPADPGHPLHLLSASSVTTDGGSSLRLAPGWYLTDGAWSRLDVEMRRLQDAETRLTAENNSFRASATSWSPPWWLIASAFAAGSAAGWYAREKL